MGKTLILFRGIPGSGKTTAAKILSSSQGSIPYPVYSADDYFYENGPNTGEFNYDASSLKLAHAQCVSRTELAMECSVERVFVANTFTTDAELEQYYELARKYNYITISMIVENRHGHESIHNVPAVTITKMKDRFSIKL